MKKLALTLALSLASLGAFAQVADAGANAGAFATTAPISLTNNFGSAPERTFGYQFGESRLVQSGIPVATAASPWATQPVWKCTGAGDAGALQLKDFGFSLSLGGKDKNVCAVEFRIAVAGFVAKLSPGTEEFKLAHALACTDDILADGFERTTTMKCDEPDTDGAARKARWAEQRRAKQALGEYVAPRPVAMMDPALR